MRGLVFVWAVWFWRHSCLSCFLLLAFCFFSLTSTFAFTPAFLTFSPVYLATSAAPRGFSHKIFTILPHTVTSTLFQPVRKDLFYPRSSTPIFYQPFE